MLSQVFEVCTIVKSRRGISEARRGFRSEVFKDLRAETSGKRRKFFVLHLRKRS